MNSKLSNACMQLNGNSSNLKLPTPQNVSKWSIRRKKVLNENNSLRKEVISKDSIIDDLRIKIRNYEIKESLRGSSIPDGIGVYGTVYFDANVVSHGEDCITYSISSSNIDFETEVEVYYSDIIESLPNPDFTQRDLERCVEQLISDSLNL